MSNNTARLAREWAQFELDNAGEFSDKGRVAAAEHILATTTPLTMADVDWDVEKHYLAGATSEIDGSELVMVAPLDDLIVSAKPGGDRVSLTSPDVLTPNGKRYELVEVGAPEQPAHPETLETQADYENAPEGTIVNIDGTVAIRGVYGWICTGEDAIYRTRGMFDQGEGDVIRWGWGK